MAAEATLRGIEAAARRLPHREQAVPARLPVADGHRAAHTGRALAAAPVPVLVVRGQASALLSAEDAQVLAAMTRSGRCVTLPDAGHSPHIDRPRATAAELTTFAAEVRTRPPSYVGAPCE
jgi:pimeloyl-[acyl-carrier protein] methyl ester esterase